MKLKIRKKRIFKKTKEFVLKIKKVHEKTKTALKRSQEEIRKYIDRKKNKAEEY